MILLILVAALWIAVLAPRAWRRIAESGGVGSVDHFHHQLELLEHAGPKLVRPAYRLRSGEAGAGPTTSVSSRPKLVLLRAVDDERAADIDGVDGAHYARVGVIQRPEESVSPAQTPSEMAAYRRQLARRRCTLVLRLLAATALSTGILGVLPAMRLAWIFTGITGVAALAHGCEFIGVEIEPETGRIAASRLAEAERGAAVPGEQPKVPVRLVKTASSARLKSA